jgi:PIN domain nuclease of toxin-antitoxin system
MKYLLDTHVLIFLGSGDIDRIGEEALKVYQDPETRVYVSQISFWEMAIKINIGKLHIPIGLKNVMESSQQAGIETISVQNSHILNYQSLEAQEDHRDPFDRYIIATALSEKLKILSNDSKFDIYNDVVRVWD